jgi:hypothetical protein
MIMVMLMRVGVHVVVVKDIGNGTMSHIEITY